MTFPRSSICFLATSYIYLFCFVLVLSFVSLYFCFLCFPSRFVLFLSFYRYFPSFISFPSFSMTITCDELLDEITDIFDENIKQSRNLSLSEADSENFSPQVKDLAHYQ